jgi:hypothetical protein
MSSFHGYTPLGAAITLSFSEIKDIVMQHAWHVHLTPALTTLC